MQNDVSFTKILSTIFLGENFYELFNFYHKQQIKRRVETLEFLWLFKNMGKSRIQAKKMKLNLLHNSVHRLFECPNTF